jgi:hypothetical protein
MATLAAARFWVTFPAFENGGAGAPHAIRPAEESS